MAQRALKWASVGLSVATLALLLTGMGSPVAVWARLVAGAGLVTYAVAATSIWLPVARVARGASDSFERRVIPVAAGWFVLVTWGDAVVVIAGTWRFLDALGAALLLGGLLQAILVALVYLGPMLRGRSPAHRTALRERLQRYSLIRVVALNVGLVLIVVATIIRESAGQAAALAGWLLIVVAVARSLWPLVPRP